MKYIDEEKLERIIKLLREIVNDKGQENRLENLMQVQTLEKLKSCLVEEQAQPELLLGCGTFNGNAACIYGYVKDGVKYVTREERSTANTKFDEPLQFSGTLEALEKITIRKEPCCSSEKPCEKCKPYNPLEAPFSLGTHGVRTVNSSSEESNQTYHYKATCPLHMKPLKDERDALKEQVEEYKKALEEMVSIWI